MKNVNIECYIGDFIATLGRPHLMLVGYEDDKKFSCEKYLFIERRLEQPTRFGEIVEVSKFVGYTDNLKDFMENQGLEHVKSIIYLEAYKEAEKKNYPDLSFGLRGIILRKTNQTSLLMYLKRVSESQLKWIASKTSSEKLKDLIRLCKAHPVVHNKFE